MLAWFEPRRNFYQLHRSFRAAYFGSPRFCVLAHLTNVQHHVNRELLIAISQTMQYYNAFYKLRIFILLGIIMTTFVINGHTTSDAEYSDRNERLFQYEVER